MAETMTASGMAGPRRVRCCVYCWAGGGKKQIVVTRESRGDSLREARSAREAAPSPRVFCAKSAESVENNGVDVCAVQKAYTHTPRMGHPNSFHDLSSVPPARTPKSVEASRRKATCRECCRY